MMQGDGRGFYIGGINDYLLGDSEHDRPNDVCSANRVTQFKERP